MLRTLLRGSTRKAKRLLGWEPKTRFDDLVKEMAREDLKTTERDDLVKKHGYKSFEHYE